MGKTAFDLPLFPLNLVLFPGMMLPLHIFEPRYRVMTRRCLEQQRPFGVVLVRPGSAAGEERPFLVGTCAQIMAAEPLKDGRFNLLTEGQQRFRIVQEHHDQPYLKGLVEPVEDSPGASPEALEALRHKAATLFRHYMQVVLVVAGKEQLRLDIPAEAEALSYLIGACLDLSDLEKQRLLELPSTAERLESEVELLRREEQLLRRILSSTQVRPPFDDPHASLN